MKKLLAPSEVKTLIEEGKTLLISGSEEVLSVLPKGKWIGGTIPYFMTPAGGITTQSMIQVTILPPEIGEIRICEYTSQELDQIPANYFQNGMSAIIVPAFTETHQIFARDCSTWKGIFNQPLVGWISGVHLQNPHQTPLVFNGETGRASKEKAVVMHARLAPDRIAVANIINFFEQGQGDEIIFLEAGFDVQTALINGNEENFASYIERKKQNTTLPLVADYCGAMINVSIQESDSRTGQVHLFAPVFPGVKYKFAKAVVNYEQAFREALSQSHIENPIFACNCVLNYLYANLEGKQIGDFSSPMTFGEIAYMLLNQTFVYVTLETQAT